MKHVLAVLLATSLMATPAAATLKVQDDAGHAVVLARPAQRIVALAPHVTEMLFAAGGGERIVGAVEYSDFPEAAKRIPRVGSNRQLDIERIVALKPDLIVVWMHTSAERQIEQLRRLGIPVFQSEPRRLADIPSNVERLGILLGTDASARRTAEHLRKRIDELARQYTQRPPVRTFYQVWHKPLYTLNGAHIVSDVLRLCGGRNIFDGLKTTAPVVSVEAVLQQDPEVILDATEWSSEAGGRDLWLAFGQMTAVKRGNLFNINGDLMNRAGPRMVDGAVEVCGKLEQARTRRAP